MSNFGANGRKKDGPTPLAHGTQDLNGLSAAPEGWCEKPLGEIARFQRGFDLPEHSRRTGTVPVISSAGICGWHDTAAATGPGIVTGRYGTIGNLHFVDGPYWPLNTALWVCDFFENDPQYVFHLLSTFDFARFSGKTGVPGVNRNELHAVRILVAPVAEQPRIAEVLSTWDRAIETVEALISNSGARKAALKQSLLTGKQRLPGFTGEWVTIRLGDAFAERSERGEDGLPLLSVTQSDGVIPQGEAGRKNISSADQSNYKTVRKGDIAYNTMRMWQGASALSHLTGKVSPAYTVVTPRPQHDAHFYAYLFKWPTMVHIFERNSQGLVSDTWNLKYPHFAKISVCVPSLEEQIAIRKVLEGADAVSAGLEGQLAALIQEKSALKQQLLTGKRRVNIDQLEAA